MPKTCKHPDCSLPVFGGGYCSRSWHQALRTDEKYLKSIEKRKEKAKQTRKPINKMSKQLSGERKTYRELREEFLSKTENTFCAVYPSIPATQIHHMRGRGKYLNDVSTWLAVSDIGHAWIEANPALARERGFTMSRLELVTPLNEIP